jgi:hypothetical protein
VADDAGDIGHGPATAADEMMVVVADPAFVEHGGASRFDPTQEPGFGQGRQGVVNSLGGRRADLGFDQGRRLSGVEVSAVGQDIEDGDSGSGHPQPPITQQPTPFGIGGSGGGPGRHEASLDLFWIDSKKVA